jgi:hypothetical protein
MPQRRDRRRLGTAQPQAYTFVSIMSAHGEVPVEETARLARHSDMRTTETVYRHESSPVIRTGAGVMDCFPGKKNERIIGMVAG